MKIEIDIAEHHYNNIMALDSVSLGRVPYKGIIMYSINAIKHGRVLEQEPPTENDLEVQKAIEIIKADSLAPYSVEDILKARDLAVEALKQMKTAKNSLSAEEVTALAEWTEKLTEANKSAYSQGYADGMKAQEPQKFKWCTDCREYDQEKHCCHRWSKVIRDTVEEMKQESKTGHWIKLFLIDTSDIDGQCSECGFIHKFIDGHTAQYNYCPNCGAKMVEPQESEE